MTAKKNPVNLFFIVVGVVLIFMIAGWILSTTGDRVEAEPIRMVSECAGAQVIRTAERVVVFCTLKGN